MKSIIQIYYSLYKVLIYSILTICFVTIAEPVQTLFPNSKATGRAGQKTPDKWTHFSTQGDYSFAVDNWNYHSSPSSASILGKSGTGRACLGMFSKPMESSPGYYLSFWFMTSKNTELNGFIRFDNAIKPIGGKGLFLKKFTVYGKAKKWRQFKLHFAYPSKLLGRKDKIKANFNFYGDSNGKVWIDDVILSKADPPLPNPLDKDFHINKLKKMYRKTQLTKFGKAEAVIIAGKTTEAELGAQNIQKFIRSRSGVTLPIISKDILPQEILKNKNVIATGNMATNAFIARLYKRYYTYLDRYYPGKNGYVIRSVHNLFGFGKNVIFVGASDKAGMQDAVDRFIKKLPDEKNICLNWLMDIKLGKGMQPPAPGTKVYAWRCLGGDHLSNKFFGWNPINIDFALYYMTGNKSYLDDVRKLIFPNGQLDPRLTDGDRMFGNIKHPLATVYHYRGHITPMIWDLIEESPDLSDKERLYITNELLEHQKHLSIAICKKFMNSPVLPDRHEIYEILNIFTGSRYFAYSYPAKEWNKRVNLCKKALALSLTTPDSNAPRIQTATVIVPLIDFALWSGTNRYFIKNGCFSSRMNKWLFLGDELVPRHWNYFMLNSSVYLLHDKRFLDIRKKPLKDRFRIGQAYWTGNTPDTKNRFEGLKCFRMPAPIYLQCKLNIPLSEAFKYIIYRSGEENKKQFLALYGFYEGSKSPVRVNSILKYQQQGINMLLPCSNEVQVTKNGIRQNGPSHASAIKDIDTIGPLTYIKTKVPDHDFSEWTRSLLLIKNRGLVVFDKILIKDTGYYDISSSWYTQSRKPSLKNDGVSWKTDEVKCFIKSLPSVKVCLNENIARFKLSGQFYKNQKKFIALLLTQGDKASISKINKNSAFINAMGPAVVGTKKFAKDNLSLKSDAYFISNDSIALINCSAISFGGYNFNFDRKVNFYWNLNNGQVLVKTRNEKAEIKITGLQNKTLKCLANGKLKTVCKLQNSEQSKTMLNLIAHNAFEENSGSKITALKTKKTKQILTRRWQFSAGSSITALKSYSYNNSKIKGILAGTRNGGIYALNKDGVEQWRYKAKDAIYCLETVFYNGKLYIFAGSDDENLYCFNKNGQLQWKYKAKVSKWMLHNHSYWTMNGKAKVRKILIADANGDKCPDIFIGTGGAAIERLDLNGKQKWLFTFRFGTPSAMVLADVWADNPGKELTAGSFDCSFSCDIRYIDVNTGKEITKYGSPFYPPSEKGEKHAIASYCLGNAWLHTINLQNGKIGLLRGICGNSWNKIVMNNAVNSKFLWEVNYGPDLIYKEEGEQIRILNGYIRNLFILKKQSKFPLIVAGLSNGWLNAYSVNGKLKWAEKFYSPITAATGDSESIFVACKNGEAALFTNGRRVAETILASPLNTAVPFKENTVRFVGGSYSGKVTGFALGKKQTSFFKVPSRIDLLPKIFQSQLKNPEEFTIIGIGDDCFICKSSSTSAKWTIKAGTNEKFIKTEHGFKVIKDSCFIEKNIRIILPGKFKLNMTDKSVEIIADNADYLVLKLTPNNINKQYESGILINKEDQMKTNGAIAKLIMHGRLKLFLPKKAGDWGELSFEIDKKGKYDIAGKFCNHNNYGIFNVLIDGKLIQKNLNFYSSKTKWGKKTMLAKGIKLNKGIHYMRFILAGKAHDSTGRGMGFESISFMPYCLPNSLSIQRDSKSLQFSWIKDKKSYNVIFALKPSLIISKNKLIGFCGKACSLILSKGQVFYWEIIKGNRLYFNDKPIVETDKNKTIFWQP